MGTLDCKSSVPKRLRMKMGVVADDRFLKGSGGEEAAKKKIVDMWKVVSEPYIEQFNIEIIPAVILFGEGFPECADPGQLSLLSTLDSWRNSKAPSKLGAWFGVFSCQKGGVAGWANVATIGGTSMAVGIGEFDQTVIAHEIGHTFSMDHDDSSRGIMAARLGRNTPFEFFSGSHSSKVCDRIKSIAAKSGRSSRLVPFDEMWEVAEETTTTSAATTTRPGATTTVGPGGTVAGSTTTITTAASSSGVPDLLVPVAVFLGVIFLLFCVYRGLRKYSERRDMAEWERKHESERRRRQNDRQRPDDSRQRPDDSRQRPDDSRQRPDESRQRPEQSRQRLASTRLGNESRQRTRDSGTRAAQSMFRGSSAPFRSRVAASRR